MCAFSKADGKMQKSIKKQIIIYIFNQKTIRTRTDNNSFIYRTERNVAYENRLRAAV